MNYFSLSLIRELLLGPCVRGDDGDGEDDDGDCEDDDGADDDGNVWSDGGDDDDDGGVNERLE